MILAHYRSGTLHYKHVCRIGLQWPAVMLLLRVIPLKTDPSSPPPQPFPDSTVYRRLPYLDGFSLWLLTYCLAIACVPFFGHIPRGWRFWK